VREGREDAVAATYPLQRLGVPEDVAGAVAFLCSRDAGWITGQTIVIDGGIIVTVVKIDRNQVRLGIEAPGHIPVYREEILPLSRQNHDAEQLAVCS